MTKLDKCKKCGKWLEGSGSVDSFCYCPTLQTELRPLLNKHSRENESNTPDFILAQYLMDCLKAWEEATKLREKWHGRS